MSYRFDVPLVANGYHFGNRGLGVLGSNIASTGTNGPGYIYNDLSLPADANKEYSGYVVTPPGVGTFFAFEDSSFTYDGPSTSFVYRLREDGIDLGTQTVTITMASTPAASANWTEADDVAAISTALSCVVSAAWTEANDISSISASVAGTQVSVTSAWTEVDDTHVIGVSSIASSVVSWSEVDDTSALTALVNLPVNGTVSWTEVDDVSYVYVSVASGSGLPSSLLVRFKNPKYKITFKQR